MDIPHIFKSFNGLVAAQTNRNNPFRLPQHIISVSDLNLSDEQNEKNKINFFNELGIIESQITYAKQVHGNAIAYVDRAQYLEGFDALITNKKNIFLLVSIADCTPVLIYDSINNAFAAIHAGWRGTEKQIVSKTLKKMNEQFGTIGKNCFAYIGTCISENSFEVGEEVAMLFDKQFVVKQKHKWHVNLKEANKSQLMQFGLPTNQIEISEHCTVINNNNYFSYRKENGKTGRLFALIGMKP